MSERFKFRAWLKDEKVMVDVEQIDFYDCTTSYIYDNYTTGEQDWMTEDIKNVELLQHTGLKDKNGVEIYEGDVIASQNKDRDNWYVSHHEVVWHDTGFMGKQICSGSYIGLDYWTRGENGYVVIGNIYENPDLLEETK